MNHQKRPFEPVHNLSIGQIYEVNGNQIRIEIDLALEELTRVYAGEVYAIGQFGSIIQIPIGRKVIFAMVSRLTMKNELVETGERLLPKDDMRVIVAELFGEGIWRKDNAGQWKLKFDRGVADYPLPLQTVYLTEKSTLAQIYDGGSESRIKIGTYVGSGGVGCFADISVLIGKHTALLGSTGTGKSATASSVIHSILEPEPKPENWSPQIIILDAHGEYKEAFESAKVLSMDDGSLSLPYWAMSGLEFLTLVFGKTLGTATRQVPKVRDAVSRLKQETYNNQHNGDQKIGIESPIPFSLQALSQQLGSDEGIKDKLDVLIGDSRKAFITQEWDGSTSAIDLIQNYFLNECAPLIIDLSGIPNDVAGICCSTIASLLFNFKVWQTPEEREKNPTLLVCEEAHRYVPNRGEAQYGAAQEAIQRIAKEGRKYGVGLFLVSQRPSEIDQTVLSQCNSWIVLRLTNGEDQSRVASILPDSLFGLTKMLSGLRDREAIFAGLAADISARVRIRDLDATQVPASNDIDFIKGWSGPPLSDGDLDEISGRWTRQSFSAVEEESDEPKAE